MIKSMTAFSQVSNTIDDITAEVTMRSYNSRHLDMVFYSPEFCQGFEDRVKKIVSKTHDRGRVEIRLQVMDESKEQAFFEIDESRARSYFEALEKIRTELDLSPEINLDNMLTLKNIILPAKKEYDSEKIWGAVGPTVEAASFNLDAMRKQEGKNLYQDLKNRIDFIENQLKAVERQAKSIPGIYRDRLLDRISDLISGSADIDPVRIAQEAAVLADKSDVTEEITRVYSHVTLFRDTMDSKVSQGRKLNFLVQEFNREFNTIGSKAGSAELSHIVVNLKSELEKIREQVQNIE